jgi:hypothetical protein
MSMIDNFDDNARPGQQVTKKPEPPTVQQLPGNPLERAGIDAQLAAARANPRSLEAFMSRSRSMISLPHVAEECVYALPRAGKKIEGASSRFAEIIIANYGNCRCSAAVVDEGEEFITARGLFHDLEANVAVSVEVQRRIVDSKGRRFNIDMIAVTGNAACSIALRNATLRGIPKALWSNLYERAREIIAGGGHDAVAIDTALAYCEKRGVSAERVLKFLELEDKSEIMPDHLVTLRGAWQSIKDGEAEINEMFKSEAPPAPEAPPTAKAKVQKGTPSPKPGDIVTPSGWLDDFVSRCITTDKEGLGDLSVELQDHAGGLSAPAYREAERALEAAVLRTA